MDDKQPARMFYELNYSKIFVRSFGLNVLNRVSKIRIFCLNRVEKSVIFVLERIRVSGAGPHLPIQEYIEYASPRESETLTDQCSFVLSLFLPDVNECVDSNDCMQTCTNFPGGRNCSCLDAFKVDPKDSTACIRKSTTCLLKL